MLEKHGKRILGLRYRDPIFSFAEFQEFSIMNPEVLLILITLELFIVIVTATTIRVLNFLFLTLRLAGMMCEPLGL